MKKEEVQYSNCDNNKWEQEVKCEKSGKSGVVYRESPPDSLNKGVSYIGYGGYEIGNDGGTSKGHLSSGEDVSYKRSYYYKKE